MAADNISSACYVIISHICLVCVELQSTPAVKIYYDFYIFPGCDSQFVVMELMEANIRLLLEGKTLEDELLCDFSLKDQNEAAGMQLTVVKFFLIAPGRSGAFFIIL